MGLSVAKVLKQILATWQEMLLQVSSESWLALGVAKRAEFVCFQVVNNASLLGVVQMEQFVAFVARTGLAGGGHRRGEDRRVVAARRRQGNFLWRHD